MLPRHRRGCRSHVLVGGVARIVHVLAPVLGQRLATGDHVAEMIAVRLVDDPEKVTTYRHVEILGPSELLDTPDHPLPGTNGRGICYLVTKAPLRVYSDSHQTRIARQQAEVRDAAE